MKPLKNTRRKPTTFAIESANVNGSTSWKSITRFSPARSTRRLKRCKPGPGSILTISFLTTISLSITSFWAVSKTHWRKLWKQSGWVRIISTREKISWRVLCCWDDSTRPSKRRRSYRRSIPMPWPRVWVITFSLTCGEIKPRWIVRYSGPVAGPKKQNSRRD